MLHVSGGLQWGLITCNRGDFGISWLWFHKAMDVSLSLLLHPGQTSAFLLVTSESYSFLLAQF
jgi:hypothetical protein